MAGRGPAPKPAAIRQRTNKSASAKKLPAGPSGRRVPALPRKRGRDQWLKRTREWWKSVWESPMAREFLDADLDGLFRLAVLVDHFWRTYEVEVLKEIRLQEQRWGLSPLDRRRLEWEVARKPEKADAPKRDRQEGSSRSSSDPRAMLRAVR